MAKIVPFRGIVYNPRKVENLADVATPPYDVISHQEQIGFYDRHPRNIIRLILGKTYETDTETDNRYTRSAACFRDWLSEGVLVQDESAALYLTSLEFPLHSQPVTRWGLIALVGLEPFDKGVILPHEKTFSRIKSERLDLMKSCHANFSPVFSLYPDSEQVILHELQAACTGKSPDMKFTDIEGQIQKLWRITDPAVQQKISGYMKEKSIFIADGHHRYETALNYRQWVSENTPGFSPDHPANYIMMYLCGMEDPGLVILPAHRVLRTVDPEIKDRFISAARDFFDITSFAIEPESLLLSEPENWDSIMETRQNRTHIGVVAGNRSKVWLLAVKPGVMKHLYGQEMSDNLLELDVTVLTRLILIDLLGLDRGKLDSPETITYSSRIKTALKSVRSGDAEMAFILNPTRIDQVQRIAESGEIMPRKSTYFYPKVITGQVINRLTA